MLNSVHKAVLPINLLLGCGTGNYMVAASKFVGKVTGVDRSEDMVRQAKQKTAHLANVEVHSANILSLPFPDQQFDGVICDQVH